MSGINTYQKKGCHDKKITKKTEAKTNNKKQKKSKQTT